MSLDAYLQPANPTLNIYLTTTTTYTKTCKNCPSLHKAEDTGTTPFSKRIHCTAEKCIKTEAQK
jgi:hypothetical protein